MVCSTYHTTLQDTYKLLVKCYRKEGLMTRGETKSTDRLRVKNGMRNLGAIKYGII